MSTVGWTPTSSSLDFTNLLKNPSGNTGHKRLVRLTAVHVATVVVLASGISVMYESIVLFDP
jgi:hypothetical protein